MGARDGSGSFDLLRLLGQSNAMGVQPLSGAFRSPWDPQGVAWQQIQRMAPQSLQRRGTSNGGGGKAAAESYLGRSISGPEYDSLIRATHAESGQKNSPEEQAMIMGSILNRARTNPGGIQGALNAPNQFQSVTGTRDSPGPSQNYRQGPSDARAASIESAATNLLPRVPTNQINFTAASRSAYGAGTNIGYLADMQKTGGAVYGGTQFGSSLAPRGQAPQVASNPPQQNQMQPPGQVGGNIFQALGSMFGARG